MTPQTLCLVNHTHTDFGYTDYPGTLYRLHRSIIDRAIDVCEAHAHLPDESRFRWTCEVTEITLDWLRHAPAAQIDRFLALQRAGLIGVAGMAMHWTPLVSPALAERAFDRVRILRAHGIDVRTAWQCDVNGLGWFWTDMLLDAGIDRLVMAPNPHRGMPDALGPRLFDWRTPAGRVLPTLHGWHYTYGTNSLRFSEDSTEGAAAQIDRVFGRPGAIAAWTHPVMIVQVTNKASPDNGYPTDSLSGFVTRWNAEGRSPRLAIRTLDQAMDALLDVAPEREVLSGDWPDYWADGVASTAFETAAARTAERIIPVTDMLAATAGRADDAAQTDAVHGVQLYDEHTWGAYSAITMPDAPFARFQWSWKTHRAHEGLATALEAATRAARDRARAVTGLAVENDVLIRLGDAPAVAIEDQAYYVMNPSPVARRIRWPVPRDYGGASPATILHGWLTEEFMPGMNVQRQRRLPSATHVIEAELPPWSEAVVRPVPATPQGEGGADWIANDRWRLQIDPATGAAIRLTDRATGLDVAIGAQGLGRVLYETPADAARGRAAIFGSGDGISDWTRLETIAWPAVPTTFLRRGAAEVAVGSPRQTLLGPEIDVRLAWPHGDRATLTWRLPAAGPGIDLKVTVEKVPVTAPESVFVVFALEGDRARVDLDIGDMTADADDILPQACASWSTVQRFATVATDSGALTVATPDAPLVHPFGAQTEGAGRRVLHDGALAFWVMNNHWDVNFAASQSGAVSFRFHLLPQAGPDRAAAEAFAAAATTPPVIVRVPEGRERAAAAVAEVTAAGPVDLRLRPFGAGDMLATLVNRGDAAREATLRLPGVAITAAQPVAPTGEALGSPLALRDGAVTVSLPPHAAVRLRLTR